MCKILQSIYYLTFLSSEFVDTILTSFVDIVFNICWYRICHICWYSVCDIYNFITYNYQQYFLNTYHFTNTWGRIPAIIFFARIIPFTLAKVFVNIPFFIWMRCCTIEFEFTITWNMFYQCFCFIYFCYHIAFFNIFVFCFTGNTYFRGSVINKITTSITFI